MPTKARPLPSSTSPSLLIAALLLAGCSGATPSGPGPRAPGARSPLTAPCGGSDEPRCMMPFPSSAFLSADPTTATGLRVAIEDSAPPRPDDPSSINVDDGFSRLSPIVTGFTGNVDPASIALGAVRLFNDQPGPAMGDESLLGMRLVNGAKNGVPEAILIVTPKRPLPAASEHLVVVMDSIAQQGGGGFSPSRTTLLALGLAAPANPAEQTVFTHYAPAREMLAVKQIDPAHVLRLWDFTTRSTLDPTLRLTAMQKQVEAAVQAGTIGVAVDSVSAGDAAIGAIVIGRLTNMPDFLTAEDQSGHFVYDASGAPLPQGVNDVYFRVVLPHATRDYPLVVYGHGTGGDYTDTSFDEGLAGAGFAKIGFDFLGWTGDSIIGTVAGLVRTIEGSDRSTAHLLQAHANIAALEALLPGALGDALATALSMQLPGTPALHPNMTQLFYAGGSLGGTMGLVHMGVDRTRMRAGLLNVPGTGWTQFIPLSVVVDYARPAWPSETGGDLDIELQIASSQNAWDDVDGANWLDALPGAMPPCLLQESMGDPVLPNIGNELVAQSLGAVQVGVPLRPLPGLALANEAIARTGLTQFHVDCGPDPDPYCVHGFAAGTTPAGLAAQQQIGTFLITALLGIPRVEVPQICLDDVPDGSCDFTRFGE